MFSMNPEDTIPAGMAKIPIPKNEMHPAITFPKIVIGYISPYPTVVSVVIDHHMVDGISENISG